MIKGFKIRLLPNQEQEELLWNHVNSARFVWNYCLNLEKTRYDNNEKHLSGYDLRKNIINLKNNNEEYSWLNKISIHTIGGICMDLNNSYKNFFKNASGYPKFKKKNKCKNKFPIRTENLYFLNEIVNIEKIGKIKYQTNYDVPIGRNVFKFTNARIEYVNNKWVLSFGMECENQTQKLNDFSMGIDLGVKELAVVAYGENSNVFKNINKTKRVKNLKSKLKHLEKNVSRKYDYNNKHKVYENKYHKSNKILKAEEQIRKVHRKLSNIRRNYIHQTTHELVSLFPKRVVMEDLNVTGMMKNKHLSNAIAEQCFYEFIRQMKYKCEFNGIEFIQVDRFYPSSKTCSRCGSIKKDLKLKDRMYICPDCGFIIDRDLNAAINLMNYSKV